MPLVRHHSNPELVLDGDNLYATWLNNGTWMLMIKVYCPDMLDTYFQHLNRTLVITVVTATLFLIIAVMLSRFIVAHVAKADRESACHGSADGPHREDGQYWPAGRRGCP